MAYTFFKSMGYNVGNSICEEDKLDLARELMEEAKEKGVKFMLQHSLTLQHSKNSQSN